VRGSPVTAAGSGVSATAHVGIHTRVGRAVVVADTATGRSRHAGGATDSWASAERATDSSWLTLETVVALLTTGQATTLLLEICHADSRESGGRMVLGLVLVDLVDGNSGVDNRRLDSLLLDDWLDGPENMSITSTETMTWVTHSWT